MLNAPRVSLRPGVSTTITSWAAARVLSPSWKEYFTHSDDCDSVPASSSICLRIEEVKLCDLAGN